MEDLSSEPQDRENLESSPKFPVDPHSIMFSKSVNLLNLLQKSTICALFKAKCVNPKNLFTPPYRKQDKHWPYRPLGS